MIVVTMPYTVYYSTSGTVPPDVCGEAILVPAVELRGNVSRLDGSTTNCMMVQRYLESFKFP